MGVKRWYLYVGFATMIASIAMTAYTILAAPFYGYKMLIDTNSYGEGLFEAILIIITIPVWFVLLKRIAAEMLDESAVSAKVPAKAIAAQKRSLASARAARTARSR